MSNPWVGGMSRKASIVLINYIVVYNWLMNDLQRWLVCCCLLESD